MLFTRRTLLLAAAAAATLRARPKRKDVFFGIHFDLHPNPSDPALGRDVSEAMIQSFLDRVHPDYVQYDCKGHVGYLGYPSKVGRSAPHIVQDSLALWRRVTARNNVSLYVHFSGVWDNQATDQHPEWAVIDAKGQPQPNATSTFSPYVDQLMIPELLEASQKYDLDGVWVDGDCWATRPDYSPAAAAAFRKATGLTALPKSDKDPGWQEFLELGRAQFRRYVTRYADALHKAHPGFQVASNWFYSALAPERPELPLDFISGDFGGDRAIASGRLEARLMSQQGLPWDLMGWGFTVTNNSRVFKPAVMLQQEASIVLAQGGGYQVYYNPSRAGYLEERNVERMADLGRFCRERQAVVQHSETIPQIGMVFSKHSLYRTSGRLFGDWGAHVDPARGTLAALLECQYSVDVLPEWKVAQVASNYPLLLIPDWPDLGTEMRDTALAYAKQGGTLVLLGAKNAQLFQPALGVNLPTPPTESMQYLDHPTVVNSIQGLWITPEPTTAKVIAHRYPEADYRKDAQPVATLTSYGAGRILTYYGPAGAALWKLYSPAFRDFLHTLLRQVFTPAVEVKAPPTVEVVLRRKNNKKYVHLINTNRMGTLDYLPPAGPIELKSGAWSKVIERLEIHAAVEYD